MSEMPPEPGQPQQGNFLTRKYGGIPGVVWMAGAAVVAYFLFFRGKGGGGGGASSSGGGGTSTTGDISIQPGTETIDLTGEGPTTTIANPAPVNPGGPNDSDNLNPSGPMQTGTPNPQPTPTPPPRVKQHHTKVAHKAGTPQYVTVAKWPGHSVNGLAQWNTTLWGISKHEHTSIADLLKLNPWIKNPNLLQPGERIRVK